MKRSGTFLPALLLLLTSGVAVAGVEDAKFFFGVDADKGNLHWQSAFYASNLNEEPADLTYFFSKLVKNAAAAAKTTITIQPGERVLIRPAPFGKTGMVGLESEVQLHYRAVLGVTTGASPGLAHSDADLGVDFDELRIVDSSMAYAGGTGADVEVPWGVREFVVINFATTPNSCTAVVYDSNHNEVGMRTMSMKPTSMKRFKGVTGLVSGTPDKHGRVVVECTKPFYPQGFFLGGPDQNVATASPQPALAPPPQSGCELPGSYCLLVDGGGLVHEPTKSPATWVRRINFRPPPGIYTQMIVHMDVINRGWANNAPGLHNIGWMGFNGRNRDMPLYLNVFGPNKNAFLWRWGYNLGAADKFKVKVDWTMQVNTLYHIRYSFDMKNGLIEVLVTRGGIVELQLLGDPRSRI